MARIRSTHPGQWSDEDFVSLSFPARLLALAVRNIADDHGVFEWKPLTLKMQLFPADAVDVAALLSELVSNNIAIMFEEGGKKLGAVRNFMRWQRPKKPNYTYAVTPQVLEYVGFDEAKFDTIDTSDDKSSVPVPNQFPTGGEKSPQRKEEGGSSRSKKELLSETSSDDSPPKKRMHSYSAAFEAFWASYPTSPNMSKLRASQALDKLDAEDQRACADAVAPYRAFLASKPDHPTMHAATFINERRFDGFIGQSSASPRDIADDDWLKRLSFARTNRQWHVEAWGPFPNVDGCRVPTHLLQPDDGQAWAVWEA